MTYEHKVLDVIQRGKSIEKTIEINQVFGWELQTQSKMLFDRQMIYTLTFRRPSTLVQGERLKDLESKVTTLIHLRQQKIKKDFNTYKRNLIGISILQFISIVVFVFLLFLDLIFVITFSMTHLWSNIGYGALLLGFHTLQFIFGRWLRKQSKLNEAEDQDSLYDEIERLIHEAKALN